MSRKGEIRNAYKYVGKGFFTPPFDSVASLYQRFSKLYEEVDLEAMACFNCRKRKNAYE